MFLGNRSRLSYSCGWSSRVFVMLLFFRTFLTSECFHFSKAVTNEEQKISSLRGKRDFKNSFVSIPE